MWKTEWEALSARIASLLEAGNYLMRTLHAWETDHYGVTDELLRNAKAVVLRIEQFQQNYSSQLPEPARQCLADFITRYNRRFHRSPDRGPGGIPGTQGVLIVLSSFRAEFSYLLTDTEAVGRSLVTRAFTHLQRSIVADVAIRQRWQEAFDSGEVACEKLGAVHLLLHGVWAFKASAEGERTDLVLGAPLSITSDVRTATDTLVLTEWKVVRSETDLESKARQAYEQARRYTTGILAGFELSSRRYLVIVSSDMLTMPNSYQEGSVTYEYVNVAVSPRTPSATR